MLAGRAQLPHDNPEPISELLPRLRRELGISQCVLASRLATASGNDGLTREEVSRWERGKRIPGPYWRAWLSLAFELPRAELERAASIARESRRCVRTRTQLRHGSQEN